MDRSVVRTERTAVIVEHDAFVLSALAELLSDEGFDVHTATNGPSGLRVALDVRPQVVLLDLVLPERSGAEILAELRSEPATREAAIVVVAGRADDLDEAQLAQVDGLIAKPVEVGDLLTTVQHALQRAAARRAEVAPVSGASHREGGADRQRRSPGARRSRPRR